MPTSTNISYSYPAQRHVRVTNVCGRWQLAYAPDDHPDPLTAYSASLHETEDEAKADVAEYLDDRQAASDMGHISDFDRGDEEQDESHTPCLVLANGDIEIDAWGITMTRERIYSDFGIVPST